MNIKHRWDMLVRPFTDSANPWKVPKKFRDVMKTRAWTNRRDALSGRVSGYSMVDVGGQSVDKTVSVFNKEKWLPLTYLPFKISHKCCGVMKKGVLAKYQRENGVVPILGTMAAESRIRRQGWIKTGCNAFDGAKSKSQPLSFWTEQDVLEYILRYKLPIASVYGDVVFRDEKSGLEYGADMMVRPNGCKLCTTGVDRTGCIFCGFGFHLEKGITRFQRIKKTHPKQYDYCMRGGMWIDNPEYAPNAPEYDGIWKNWNPKQIWVPGNGGLGFAEVFRMVNEVYGENFYRWE